MEEVKEGAIQFSDRKETHAGNQRDMGGVAGRPEAKVREVT